MQTNALAIQGHIHLAASGARTVCVVQVETLAGPPLCVAAERYPHHSSMWSSLWALVCSSVTKNAAMIYMR